VTSLDWQERGSCARLTWVDPDWWFPGQGQRGHAPRAIAICTEDCPVRTECFEYAVATDTADGVWGGHDFGRSA
jgi:WhiB family redox-sensing transcriptional regulator